MGVGQIKASGIGPQVFVFVSNLPGQAILVSDPLVSNTVRGPFYLRLDFFPDGPLMFPTYLFVTHTHGL